MQPCKHSFLNSYVLNDVTKKNGAVHAACKIFVFLVDLIREDLPNLMNKFLLYKEKAP